jgi:hypothetical protein
MEINKLTWTTVGADLLALKGFSNIPIILLKAIIDGQARSCRYTMNQRFSSQGLTSIVGATLAVAVVKYESEFSRTTTDKQDPSRV